MDKSDNVYISDFNNNVIEEVSAGMLTVIAGGGGSTPTTSPQMATSVSLNNPFGVAVDNSGNVYLADSSHQLIEEVRGGNLTVIAGGGVTAPSTSPQPAISVNLSDAFGVAVDSSGNVYIADGGSFLEEVSGGNLTIIAGGGGRSQHHTKGGHLRQPFRPDWRGGGQFRQRLHRRQWQQLRRKGCA